MHKFTEKCFVVFGQSSHTIDLTWYWLLLFFWKFSSIIPFMVWLQDQLFLILPPVWLSNLSSDLSVDNIFRLGISWHKKWHPRCCQEGARTHRKVKIPKLQRQILGFFSEICLKHDTPLQSLGIYYSSAFCSTYLSFFVLKIFGFNWISLFVRYFASISRFGQFVQPWTLYEVSLFYYQMTTNSVVNKNLASVINNWNNSYCGWTNKVIYKFCLINELLIWFKIKIIGSCFNFIWG